MMKENQTEVLFHSNGYEKGADLLLYSTNELCGSEANLEIIASGLAGVDDFLNIGVAKNSEFESVGNHPKNGIEKGYVPFVDNHDGPLWHPSECGKAVESLVSEKDNDEIQSSSKLMPSVIIDGITPCIEQESVHYEASFRLLGSNPWAYTDKNVVECELPELDVPSNVHIVKDICVDTGVVPHERTLIESNQDASQSTKEDLVRESVNGELDTKIFFPEGSAVEDTKKNTTNNYGSWVIFDSVEGDESKSSLEDNAGPMIEEQSLSSSDSIADIVSEEASSISSTRVSEEFTMQDSLLNSLKQEGNKVADEVPSLDTVLESLAVMFTSKESKKEDLVNKLSYNSKVEGGTITFDFKSSKQDVPSSKDGNAEIITGKSTEAASDEEPKDESNAAATTTTTLVEHASNAKMNDHDQDPSRQEDAPQKDLDPPGPTTQISCSEGESSFTMRESVSGLITYSGQIVYAGSTSVRSDSSTTSARSFAFPVLQSEWNSSPVRMEKADRRRNHKFWRNGFFCCRF